MAGSSQAFPAITTRDVLPTRFYDASVVHELLSFSDICYFVGWNSWFKLLRMQRPTYPALVKEFLNTLSLQYCNERYLDDFGISFQLAGVPYKLSMADLNEIYEIERAQTRTVFREFDPKAFWRKITKDPLEYDQAHSLVVSIRNPTLCYMYYVVANTIFGRSKGLHRVLPWELFALWSLMMGNQVNMIYFMMKHFADVVIPYDKVIVIGAYITPIAEYCGVNMGMYEAATGPNKVDIPLLMQYGMLVRRDDGGLAFNLGGYKKLPLPNFKRIRLDKDENLKLDGEE